MKIVFKYEFRYKNKFKNKKSPRLKKVPSMVCVKAYFAEEQTETSPRINARDINIRMQDTKLFLIMSADRLSLL